MARKTHQKTITVKGWDGEDIRIEDVWREVIRLCYPRTVTEVTTTESRGLEGQLQWSKTVTKTWTVEPNMKAVRMVLGNFDEAFRDGDDSHERRADEELRLRKSETLARRWSVEAGRETTQPSAVGCADDDPRGSGGAISEDE